MKTHSAKLNASSGQFRFGLKLATAILIALLVLASSGSAQTNNILLLIADDLGWDNLSSFNTNSAASIPYTPNITKLAQSGVAFTHFYARPSCSQSRACIITGRDSFRTGVGCAIGGGHTPSLLTNEYTLPRALATNAPQYALASFGKWHLAGTTTNLYDTDSPHLTGGWTNYQGFYSPQVASISTGQNGRTAFRSTPQITRRWIRFTTRPISSHRKERIFGSSGWRSTRRIRLIICRRQIFWSLRNTSP